MLHGLDLSDERIRLRALLLRLLRDEFTACDGGRLAKLSGGDLPQYLVHFFLNGKVTVAKCRRASAHSDGRTCACSSMSSGSSDSIVSSIISSMMPTLVISFDISRIVCMICGT